MHSIKNLYSYFSLFTCSFFSIFYSIPIDHKQEASAGFEPQLTEKDMLQTFSDQTWIYNWQVLSTDDTTHDPIYNQLNYPFIMIVYPFGQNMAQDNPESIVKMAKQRCFETGLKLCMGISAPFRDEILVIPKQPQSIKVPKLYLSPCNNLIKDPKFIEINDEVRFIPTTFIDSNLSFNLNLFKKKYRFYMDLELGQKAIFYFNALELRIFFYPMGTSIVPNDWNYGIVYLKLKDTYTKVEEVLKIIEQNPKNLIKKICNMFITRLGYAEETRVSNKSIVSSFPEFAINCGTGSLNKKQTKKIMTFIQDIPALKEHYETCSICKNYLQKKSNPYFA